eukprot:TRINITY_DN32_c0_g4_i2.p1 TRINITY_DN32_c0_g4~~TRINITY_DN32_c0_g4_i2.p1  ORF type:complete len:1344 (-),score=278.21 TRINITY_DN32_c0_g4_i2:37204-41235(-)
MRRSVMILLCWSTLFSSLSAQAPNLQDQLIAEGYPALVNAANQEGDARRGAVVFHQPFLACAKCHTVGQSSTSPSLGPDLTRPEATTTAAAIIESVLEPSKVLRKGYEPVTVQLADGKTVTGLFVEETSDKLILKDISRIGESVTIPKSQIEERVVGKTSVMPAGQVNVLANRQQFLDLAKYLIEITEGGPDKARQLQPPPSMFAFVLPEYEKQINHAGILRDLNAKSFQRGEAIYSRLCVNCHGTKEQPGSLPTSLKFAEGKLKNGHEPYRMYQTLTHGFGLMAPQTWMVPQQKYDVIHYIRETYLRPHNSSQYAAIDDAYLASLPKGTSRGPAPSNVEPWSTMNYGPFLMATYEVGDDGSNFAQKGIATRLDAGPGGVSRGKYWQVFDHDTLRIAAGWSESANAAAESNVPHFIDWHGINFDGRHQVHPRLSGRVSFSNPTGPGWADPETGSFDDTRLLGRDNRRYGPLPRNWGQYKGLFQSGEQVIVAYTIGTTHVLEMPGASHATTGNAAGNTGTAGAAPMPPIFTRTFQIGPRSREMLLKVATHRSKNSRFETVSLDGKPGATRDAVAVLSVGDTKEERHQAALFSGRNQIAIQKGEDFDLATMDYTIAARIKTRKGGTIFCQAPAQGPWAPDGKTLCVRGGRLTFDIGWVGAVAGRSNIADDQWHDVALTWQHESGRVRLFVDGKLDGEGTLKPKAQAAKQVIRLGFTSPNFPEPTYFVGQLGDVRFHQRSLNDAEIGRVTEIKGSSLIAHWKCEEGSADVVVDQTSKGHNGNISGNAGPANNEAVSTIVAGLSSMPAGSTWVPGQDGSIVLKLPAGDQPLTFVLSVAGLSGDQKVADVQTSLVNQLPVDLQALTKGAARRWPEELKTELIRGQDNGPFAVDILSIPENNPWFAQLRLTGFDFYPDGDRVAVCSWDGDVWQVSGLKPNGNDQKQVLTWRRIANGLFQPLGLKIVDGQIYVTCRDQLAVLRDLNGDDEIDYVECHNNDHQVTEHFHEFAMGLQTDAEGNFYYAKSGRHALAAVVPHHGTLLRVSKDGSRTDILATGFRAANGVCLNPDGTFVVTDQEGFWNPKNRINWVTPAKPGERPRFYGNLYGYHDVTDPSDAAMEPPLCWITNSFDRSPAELLWVTSDIWGPLKGSLLNLSYGYGKVFIVPFETVKADSENRDTVKQVVQGGMCELPLPSFPTGTMRGRFNPVDGHLYSCGMFAWAGNATQPGGIYRVRATGQPVYLPVGLLAKKRGMQVRFSGELDPKTACDPSRYVVRTWSLKRSADYGSKHHDEKTLAVASVELSEDRRTVTLNLPDIRPTWCMSIEFKLTGSKGEPVNGLIHNTIHLLGD